MGSMSQRTPMLDPDFSKHHPAWKLAALLVDRAPRILFAIAVLCAAYQTGGGARWLFAALTKEHL